MRGPALPAPRHATVNDALAAAAATPSGLTFVDLHERESVLPFAAVRERALRTASALRGRGVAAGDRVALVFPTSPEFVNAFFGTLLAGAVPVPLYPPLRLGRLAEYHAATAAMIRAVGARLVLAEPRTRKLLGPAVAGARPRLGCATLAELGGERTGEPGVRVEPDSLALIQFSSGSTTNPKPVALSHANLMAQLTALGMMLPAERGNPHLGVSWLPLYHDMGLIGCLLLAVCVPGPLVLIAPEHFLVRPALWLRAISRHRATLSMAPAFGYALAARRVRDDEVTGLDLSGWQMAGCGAEPISPAALRPFAERFGPLGFDEASLRPLYGLAEASLAVTAAPPGRGVRTLGLDSARLAAGEVVAGPRAIVSVGVPVAGFEVEVRGLDDRPLPERRVGRVFARGPSVMTGYFEQPGATAEVIRGGWLDTADLGFVAGGELFICGREKDVVVIQGANHAAEEFERCIEGLSGVRAGRVVAGGFTPDGESGERLIVLAERPRAQDGAADAATVDAIRSRILEHTGVDPHTILMLEPGTLPRTSSGKLRRREAVRRFLAGELQPPRRVGPALLAVEMIRSAVAFARARFARGR